jgi:8-oxo-dGTP pyrophosphatase MutT (NUDIX family)
MTCPLYQPRPPGRPWGRAGIIPVSERLNEEGDLETIFLLGKEQHEVGWRGSDLWNDFGGRSEVQDLSPEETAAREAYEESMGLLGTPTEIKDLLQTAWRFDYDGGVSFFPYYTLRYNYALPEVFAKFYGYLSKCFRYSSAEKPCIAGCPEGYIEKTELRWFTIDELREAKRSQPRMFRGDVFWLIERYLNDRGELAGPL